MIHKPEGPYLSQHPSMRRSYCPHPPPSLMPSVNYRSHQANSSCATEAMPSTNESIQLPFFRKGPMYRPYGPPLTIHPGIEAIPPTAGRMNNENQICKKINILPMRRPYNSTSLVSGDCVSSANDTKTTINPNSTGTNEDIRLLLPPMNTTSDFNSSLNTGGVPPSQILLQHTELSDEKSMSNRRYQSGLNHSERARFYKQGTRTSYNQRDNYRSSRCEDDRRQRDHDRYSSSYQSRDSPFNSKHFRSRSRDSACSGSSRYSSKSDRHSLSSTKRDSSGRPERQRTNASDSRPRDYRSGQHSSSRNRHERSDRNNRSPSHKSSRSQSILSDVNPSENPEKIPESVEIITTIIAKPGEIRSFDCTDITTPNTRHGSERTPNQSQRNSNHKPSRSPSRDSRHYRHRHSRSPERSRRRSPRHEKSQYGDNGEDDCWGAAKGDLHDETRDDVFKMMEDGQTYPEQEEDYDLDKSEESDVCLWVRCSPAELYYQRSPKNASVLVGTQRLEKLQNCFRSELLSRAVEAEAKKPPYELPPRKIRLKKMKSPSVCGKSSSSSSSCDSESSDSEEDTALEELERKKKHPYRLHQELWYNDPGEMNDGPLCRCSAKAQRSGIRHGIYPGEEHLTPCDLGSNNAHRLHHYRVTMSPHTNFLSKFPTLIKHDSHEFIFEGFSMFSHASLSNLPPCKVIRFNIEYTVLYLEESFPENFTVEGLDLFSQFLFQDLLELVDLEWRAHNDNQGCQRFHFMPRFARAIEDGGKELLSLNVILQHLLNSNGPLIPDSMLEPLTQMSQPQWQDCADQVKGMVVTQPGLKPCSLRVDQLDREQCTPGKGIYPEIIHFGIRPPQLSYAGNPSYQKAWRSYVKFRHLLANKPKVEYADRHKLLQKEMKLQEMRMKSNLKRDVTVVISSKDFKRTGIMCDIVQHALLLPVLVCHLRLHQSLDILEQNIGHPFKDRWLLQLALTHPSYRENFGTNPDHARNSLTNCGIRQPEYGDRRIHYMNTRKRGINTLINIMSRFGKREETLSHINHNERLEFLGDAVVEFLSSIHLFYMFPDLEEGGLATYRAAIVQNQHLAVLAKKLQLEKFMLYAHGSDLCHDLELRHAMANCFEALMGALFLDDGINVADKVFSETLFSEPELLDVWVNYPPHPLQEQELHGDRKWIESVPLLKELHKFEEGTGIEFTHIRLLARAFTHRSVGFNNLTLGSNQRLEFLGDTVLQLVASEYLYKFFPEHHEGHLSLLRSSLVNNRTQSVVCDDLGMAEYAIYPHPKGELKTKDKADLLEAFLGALYVDKDLEFCRTFCQVCFFPRLQPFIMNQDWNDPKSKLQQCCLTLRSMDGGEPDIPVYKVIECKGPTNTRVYTVAVYFRGERLATGSGHSIQQAEMAAAGNALDSSKHLFPQLNHQKRVIERSVKQQVPTKSSRNKKKARRKKK